MAEGQRRVNCGLDLPIVSDMKSALINACNNGYDFITVPLTHPRFKREFISGPSMNRDAPFARSDLVLSGEDWAAVVGRVSPYINCDSRNENVRKQSEQTLQQEVNYANHIGVGQVLLRLTGPSNANLAQIVHAKLVQLNTTHSVYIWVQVPMVAPSVQANHYRNLDNPEPEPDTWQWWNTFRCLCNHEKKVNVALELSNDLPSDEAILRWMGEPVRCLVVPTSVFLTNKKDFPVLSKGHQSVVRAFSRIGAQVMITGTLRHSSIKHYTQYIEHLWQTVNKDDPLSGFGEGYEDYLQIPLQPLYDNLDSSTYEIFEKDPIKYSEYLRAIYYALLDRVPPEQQQSNTQVVMVVGAGRGPLVQATLKAAEKANRKVRVYAVEKNPNAVVTLKAEQRDIWHDKVTVVSCDMRQWEAPEQADILVSELLGSFGDNELSPECLDGAQKFLKEDGISIPSSYTSYLVPVHSPKLYSEVCHRPRDLNKPSESYNFEMPFVVHQQFRLAMSETQPLFTYHHPNREPIIDNTRYKELCFKMSMNGLVHGFTGYFHATLYKDVFISIEPSTYSKGMFSWFPFFFPIKSPIKVSAGEEMVTHFWRQQNKREVWYEWAVSAPVTIPIHNPNGRAYNIGL